MLDVQVDELPRQSWAQFVFKLVDQAQILDEAVEMTVLQAFLEAPRDLFLEPRYAQHATTDVSLPIGFGQTMLKPSLLIRMASLVGLRKGISVLDVGTGSGYLASVLSRAGCHVYGVEGNGLLAQRTRKVLDKFGLERTLIQRGEPLKGWSEHGPYKAIIVSTPILSEPQMLLSQLVSQGGLMVGLVPKSESEYRISLWQAHTSGIRQHLLEIVSI